VAFKTRIKKLKNHYEEQDGKNMIAEEVIVIAAEAVAGFY
jgi:hypothetical protein